MDAEARARDIVIRYNTGMKGVALWELIATTLREERARAIEDCAKVAESYADMDYGLAFAISRRIHALKDGT